MPIATLTSKGRITLPKAVRQVLGLAAGCRIDFVAVADGFEIAPMRKRDAFLKGRFAGRNHRPVSVQAMDEAVAVDASARAAGMKLLA